METNINTKKIRELVEQYKKFNESNEKLMNMFCTEDTEENWNDNYHLIDHDWMVKWKDSIYFEGLYKSKHSNDDNVYEYIKKIIKKRILIN